jgi:hypothetical protein
MGIRWRSLLVLAAAVLAVHAWLLRPAPGAVQPAPRARQQALVMRSVPAEGSAVEVAVALPAPAPATPGPELARIAAPAVMPLLAQAPATAIQRPARPKAATAALGAANVASAAKPLPSASATPSDNITYTIPGSMLLHYKVTAHIRGFVVNGEGRLHWRQDGKEYQAKLELSGPLLPSRSQQSTGRITAQGLAPLRFSDKARSEEAAHFERDEGKVSFSSNRPDAVLMAGAQDRLSVMMQLGAMIAGKPKNFGPGTTISVQTASTRDAEVWQFTVEGEESLQLAGGELRAIKLIRTPRKEFDQKIELWLAPALDYAPARLRLTQPNGDWVDQQWSSTDKG